MKKIILLAKEKKKCIVISGTVMILCLIIMMPKVYFSIMDSCAYEREHKMDKISFELSSDVKDIAMVGRLHDVLNSYYSKESVENTLLVQEEFFEVGENEGKISVSMSDGAWQTESMIKEAGIAQYVSLKDFQRFHFCVKSQNGRGIEQYELQGNQERLQLRWDNKTKKLLYLKYCAKDIDEIDEGEIYDFEKKYIQYMNLSLVEDWIYNNKKMVSRKAHLCVDFIVNRQKGVLELSWNIID